MNRKKIEKVLKEIQDNVPQELKDALITEHKKSPELEFVIGKALESDDISDVKKERLQRLMDSGLLSKVEYEVSKKMEKRYNKYLDVEIDKAIKDGRLPAKDKLTELPFIKKMQKTYDEQKRTA